MKIYENQTIDTSGQTYLQLQTNTSAECCARCTADSDRCMTWRWTQLQYAAPSALGGASRDSWFNCELLDGDLRGFNNVSDGRPMMSGAMIGAPHASGPPPTPPPMAKDGYLGCFVDLAHGARRDLPFFFCSNQSDPTPMSGINYCAEDPRLPPILPGERLENAASSWAGARRMSPALCSMLCADFEVYGVQNGSMCFCGAAAGQAYSDGPGYGAFGAAPESECNAKCTDPLAAAAGARCGGPERNSIYKVLSTPQLPSTSSFTYVGCFPDQQGVEQMPSLPVFYCPNAQQHCRGEQAGWEGIASDCLGTALELPGPDCSGDMEQENCQRMPTTMKGGRSGPFMTHELCDALCVGFQYFAVQSGSRCYCGQSYGSQGNISQPTWCDHKCTGNKSQICGGNCRGSHSASSVYKRSTSTQQAILQHVDSSTRGDAATEAAAAAAAAAAGSSPSSGLGVSNASAAQTDLVKDHRRQDGISSRLRERDTRSHCHMIPSCQAPNASVDWSSTMKGVVAIDVPDQGVCNASWAFAAAAAVESGSAIATGKLVPLSVQGIVDCAWQFGGQSCKGGEINRGLMYAQNAGLCTAESYPFTGENAACCRSNCPVAVPGQEDGGVQGFCNVPVRKTPLFEQYIH